MSVIDVIIPSSGARRWQKVIVERLRGESHEVGVIQRPAPDWPLSARSILALEQLGKKSATSLASVVEVGREPHRPRAPELTIDLTGSTGDSPSPTLSLRFDGSPSPVAAIAALSAGRLPEVTVVRDGVATIGRAAPMADNRVLIGRGLDDVLARAITLLVAVVQRGADREESAEPPQPPPPVLSPFTLVALPRLAGELLRRRRYHAAHWRVGYRLGDGLGVPETGDIGTGWTVLPDDGGRFYADPFPLERDGRFWVFVEDYPHATRKAVISVSEMDDRGHLRAPIPVLEEAWHLSYPQVFERDGEIWMIPESSGGKTLVLYRAERFPDRWVRHAALMEGRELSDATLLDHGDRLWLFATERDGYGSTSDTLVVFHAERLVGPWKPHPMNPILIDRTAARPGGAFLRQDSTILLPTQDGTLGYGGGLGLSELLKLDGDAVCLGRPRPISATGDWPYPQIHTYNRAGRLEVIDGIAAVRKR